MEKNQTESEDGGGGWHQHVSMRGKKSAGNLSRSRLHKEEYHVPETSSSDEESTKLSKSKRPRTIRDKLSLRQDIFISRHRKAECTVLQDVQLVGS